jgi:hypothetical protein
LSINDLHFAVVVGINNYPGVSNLKFARRDAENFYDWLITGGGVPPANIVRVESQQEFTEVYDALPNRTDVNTALRRVNAAVAQRTKTRPLDREKTRLYLYVSGHGIAPEGSEAALLMANAAKDAWGENIACATYLRRYEKCQFFREVVVFADCCRLRQSADFPGPPFDVDANTNIGPVDSFLGFATQHGDAAYEPTDANLDEGRSYFTQALLEGLRGSAADRETGEINSVTLARYTGERVKKLTADKRYPQVPRMPADEQRPIVFQTARDVAKPELAKPEYNVTIRFPVTFTGEAVLLDAQFSQIASHTADSNPWVVSLKDGFYGVRPKGAPSGEAFAGNGLFCVLGENEDVQL